MARLFLDPRLVERRDHMALTLAQGRPHPDNPLPLDGQRVWSTSNLYASVQRDTRSGRYRGWFWQHVPGKREEGPYRAIASDDGISWRTTGADIADGRSLAAMEDEQEFDPRRRYKAVFQQLVKEDGGVHTPVLADEAHRWLDQGGVLVRRMLAMSSGDGVTWPEQHVIVQSTRTPEHHLWQPGLPGWGGGDSLPCLLWAPELGQAGRYVAFFRTNLYNGQGWRRERAVGRAESADFVHWEPHTLALRAAMPWHTALGHPGHDLYQLQVWRCGEAYLGALSVFYHAEDRVHLELAWSPDTMNWERVCPGQDLVPHGALGEPDGGCRYAAMRPVDLGDEVRLYYGGSDGRHNADHNGQSGLCLATFRRDRFAGLAPLSGRSGVVTTVPLRLDAPRATLNVDARGGAVRVEALDAGGESLPGFGLADSRPIGGDHLAAAIAWQQADLAALRGRQVRLRLHLDGATVYALDLPGTHGTDDTHHADWAHGETRPGGHP